VGNFQSGDVVGVWISSSNGMPMGYIEGVIKDVKVGGDGMSISPTYVDDKAKEFGWGTDIPFIYHETLDKIELLGGLENE
jgi:hypothetical protein